MVRGGYGDPPRPRPVQPNSPDQPQALLHTGPGVLPALFLVQNTSWSQAEEPVPGRMTYIHLRGRCSPGTWQY